MNITGKVSWFGGPNDPTDSGHTASGGTTKEPGIAVYNHKTLGGYWRVRAPNGKTAILRQTDIGPAPWTGRKVDVTYSALGRFGYGEHNFPTDASVTAEYLGRKPPAQGEPQQQAQSATARLPGITPPSTDQAGFQKAQKAAILGKLLSGSGERKDNPLFATGLVSTRLPQRAEYENLPAPKTHLVKGERSSTFLPAANPAHEIAAAAPGSYVNPFKGFSEGRTDQGVDFSGRPGQSIRAIGNAKVIGISPNWYKGQPFVYYELLDGPAKGRVVFVAEQIAPSVRPGQRVRAGQTIGTYAGSGTGLESGFATRSGSTLARATTGYREGEATPAGAEFKRFLGGIR